MKARSLVRAFHYAGGLYDFNFDFLTDSAPVCTEVVYKASPDGAGLNPPIEDAHDWPLMPANRTAHLFDAEYGSSEPQFDFVAFLDGDERRGRAIARRVDAFREPWRRPPSSLQHFLPATRHPSSPEAS